MQRHFEILIIGGGNAGISVAAQLLLKDPKLQIGLIEPSARHYYQPAWTLVGGGTFDIGKTVRSESSVMPESVHWIKDAVTSFDPDRNTVTCKSGETLFYDYLVVAPGIQLDWNKVNGLAGNVGRAGICSNYSFETAPYTFEALKQVKAGDTLLFTAPGTPVKCGGAPQKIMYLAADYCKKKGILHKVNIEFVTAGSTVFAVEKYRKSLQQLIDNYGIKVQLKHDLIAIDAEKQEATFKLTAEAGKTVTKSYNMIHVTPPQSAPDFIKESPLANAGGWMEVEKHSLQHIRYKNIFGIGDVTDTPNAKTGAAIRKQAPVLVSNLLALRSGKALPASYNGYGSCPLVAGYGKLILAEFDYNNKPVETFPFDQSKPRWSMWLLKKYVLPWMYWNRILKGKA